MNNKFNSFADEAPELGKSEKRETELSQDGKTPEPLEEEQSHLM